MRYAVIDYPTNRILTQTNEIETAVADRKTAVADGFNAVTEFWRWLNRDREGQS